MAIHPFPAAPFSWRVAYLHVLFNDTSVASNTHTDISDASAGLDYDDALSLADNSSFAYITTVYDDKTCKATQVSRPERWRTTSIYY